MKFLRTTFECMGCGNILRKDFPAGSISMLKKVLDSKISCGCGNKSNYNIIAFIDTDYKTGDE